ncbi:hypothetical protein G6F19_012135 [Rhizopus arrhizus]|nr:hypothetical protein G6F19_012135 [Rhizopus arrhizus]
MSKALADALNLEIDAASESIFTLGNGSKQPALGLIYDVPIEVKEGFIIPCTVEVLPTCPTPLIIGNNWLSRAKAKIDFNSSTLKVTYKNKKAEIEIIYIRKGAPLPKMLSYQQNYQHPVSLTNSSPAKPMTEEIDTSEDDDDEENDEESSEDDKEIYNDDSEDEDDSLLVLENEEKKEVTITRFKETYVIQASSTGLTIPPNSSITLTLEKPEKGSTEWFYHFDTLHHLLKSSSGIFDTCSSFIVNKRTIEIRFFNRTNSEIVIKPEEELGILEKFNLNQDVIVSSYNLRADLEMCTLEINNKEVINDDNQPLLDSGKLNKMEIGDLPLEMKRKLRTLLYKYEHIFDWNNDIIGHTEVIKHKIIIDKDAMPISHRPYRISPIEAEYLKKELEKYCKLGIITPQIVHGQLQSFW